MAKREFSNGLQHLKFMQRARQREEAIKLAEEEEVALDDSHWVAPTSAAVSERKCVVIMEADPKPGAFLGRMSFQNFNPSVDRLVEEAEAIHKRRFKVAKETDEATSRSTTASPGEARDGSRDRNVTSAVTMARDGDQVAQNKKPKLEGIQTVPGGVIRESGVPNHSRNDSKPWQGWRGGADYRLLKPSKND